MSSSLTHPYLHSFINLEFQRNLQYHRNFRLDRVVELLNRIGNPQEKLRCLHIAGTKGKGSTCAFIAHILREGGYKVGLYTSPHLTDYTERIRILQPIDYSSQEDPLSGQIQERDLNLLIEGIKPAVETLQKEKELGMLTFFEILTVLALCHFKRHGVDFVVLETGLGGRLDATNTVDSLVCAITPISLEHTQLLGSTIARIASEKAAIIKNKGQMVVVAPQLAQAQKVIKDRCQALGAKAVYVGRDIRFESVQQDLGGQTLNIVGQRTYRNLKTHLLGEHQAVNAAVAVGLVESLGYLGVAVSQEAVRHGIKETFWPGRFEIVWENPYLILDGAHNAASCQVLAKTLAQLFPGKKVILILSILQDKDKKAICRQLNRIAQSVILTKTSHPRTTDWNQEKTEDLFPHQAVVKTENVRQAIKLAFQKARDNDIILITGSLYLVGEARGIC